MNNSSDWSTECWRIALVLILTLLSGLLTGYWLESLVTYLVGYIGWLLYKLSQLHTTLPKGTKTSLLPHSKGCLSKQSQDIISDLPYATVLLNEHNEIDWANNVASEYLNIDIKKNRGQSIENFIHLPQIHDTLEHHPSEEIEISLPHDGKNDLKRHVTIKIIPLEDNLKLLIARDLSERNNINMMRKSFIANASHELRTPLTVISGYLEIMQESKEVPEYLKTAINSATDQSILMQRIIEDLLILSRLENSELNETTSSIINVPSILDSVYEDEIKLINDATYIIEKDIDNSLKITGFDAEIVSMCSNLVHNAARHTQDGTNILIQWKLNQDKKACLTVKDNGQGIPAEHIVHLTERFYRVDKGRSRDKGGTGLGLAFVQHIVQRHGGKLSINSEVGKGSEFTACFPQNRVIIAD